METKGALAGVRVLDLSRVLSGPSCTQLLADLGAEVIKVERPGVGDETRAWGPPFVRSADGDTTESGYYLSCNRNKRSVTIDLSKPEGATLVKRLLAHSDILVENYKVGGLVKYGLGAKQVLEEFPGIVYCSITGYGQTGPYASRPGYDMMAQGMGGLISMTGEPDRPPVKVPIAINDIMTGMYAAVAILAALRHRDTTGQGQQIDLGLLDVQVGWLYNQGLNYLTGGKVPQRQGTAHPNTVPYQVFKSSDGWVIFGANNDDQFRRFCELVGHRDIAADPRFVSNPARLANRDACVALVQDILAKKPANHWIELFEKAQLPCGPVYTMDQVFADPQVVARGMKISMPHPLSARGDVDLIGSPIKLSATPVTYRRPPPLMGQHTDEVLGDILGLDEAERTTLRAAGVI